jgi:hypothetical protein
VNVEIFRSQLKPFSRLWAMVLPSSEDKSFFRSYLSQIAHIGGSHARGMESDTDSW